jgi:hypothetical protein
MVNFFQKSVTIVTVWRQSPAYKKAIPFQADLFSVGVGGQETDPRRISFSGWRVVSLISTFSF